MAIWENYKAISICAKPSNANRPRYSLTSDILSFRHCSYQYGHFGNDGFVPALAAQMFFGTVIHQVLDRCHRHYWGLLPGSKQGSLATPAEVESYFLEVENALKSHGVRAPKAAVRDRALEVLQLFHKVEGPDLYPRIHDTEFRLESDQDEYLLRGVVDLLVNDQQKKNDPGAREIWDYKGSSMPGLSSKEMKDYEWQMCVYAELYRLKSGVLPSRAVLYFLNELQSGDTKRPLRAVHVVEFTEVKLKEAMSEFDKTAKAISACKQAKTWPLPDERPDEKTCDICDLRWQCPKVKGAYPLRLPV